MQDFKNKEYYSPISFHVDGFSLNSSYGILSCRLSNIPANLAYIGNSTIFATYSLWNLMGASAYYFEKSFSYNENQQHYTFSFDRNKKLEHIWQILEDKNPCHFSELKELTYSNTHPEKNYIYNPVIKWYGAELSRRWLEPANETLENCVASMMDLATTRQPETEPSTGAHYAVVGIAAVVAVYTAHLFYSSNESSSNESSDPLHILGKSNASHPSFAERIAPLNPEIPSKYNCPISRNIINDPILLDDGHHYDRESIKNMLQVNKEAKCPLNLSIKIQIRFYATDYNFKDELENYVKNIEDNNQESNMIFR